MRLALVAASLALTAASTSALAQQPADPSQPEASAFKALDKNRDGFLSPAEAAADKEIAKRFKAFDANKDGKLSEEEYRKAAGDNAKRVLADSAITTKVKTALLTARGVPSMSVSVETYEGRVQLSGFVDNKDQVAAAGKAAAGVSGVKAVKNDLKVK